MCNVFQTRIFLTLELDNISPNSNSRSGDLNVVAVFGSRVGEIEHSGEGASHAEGRSSVSRFSYLKIQNNVALKKKLLVSLSVYIA